MGAGASSFPDKLSQREAMQLANDRFDQAIFDSMKDSEGFITKEQFLALAEIDSKALEIFTAFCPRESKGEIDSRGFAKMCKDTKLYDKKFQSFDVDNIFTAGKTRQGPGKTITYDTFRRVCVPLMAAKKGTDNMSILSHIGSAQGPNIHATKTDAVRFHDDKNTYTGAHAQGGPSFTNNGDTLTNLLDRSDADVRGVKAPQPQPTREDAAVVKVQGLMRQASARIKVSNVRLEKDRERNGSDTTTTAVTQSYTPPDAVKEDIRTVFSQFAPGGEMSSSQFIKMMKDGKHLTKKFTAGDAELIYTKAKQKASGGGTVSAGMKISFAHFSSICIPAIAEKRGESVEEFVQRLSTSRGPIMNATKTDAVRFHDDKNTYTGAHAQGGPSFTNNGDTLTNLLDRSDADVRGVKA